MSPGASGNIASREKTIGFIGGSWAGVGRELSSLCRGARARLADDDKKSTGEQVARAFDHRDGVHPAGKPSRPMVGHAGMASVSSLRSRVRAVWRRRLIVPIGLSNLSLICLSDCPSM